MRRLTLTEFRTEPAVPLTPAERDALRRLHPGLRAEPTPGTEGRYDLTADQRIGLVALPTLTLEVRPKVPMSSVLFLISYACGLAKWQPDETEYGSNPDLAEMVALLLSRAAENVARRGLLSGYRTEEEALQAPRGRILFDEQLRRRLGAAPPVEVRHDVFTPDILENRLLLAALSLLARAPIRSPLVRRELVRARRPFGGIELLHFPRRAVPEVRWTRLNAHYRPALELARLVLASASLDVGAGAARGSAFLVDMNRVFEAFVRTALREALGVDRQRFPDRPPPLRLDEAGAVPLVPDLCLLDTGGRPAWVGDAKYKRLPAGAYRNADLYQLLAYAVALGLPGGTLIYAADAGVTSAEHVVLRAGKRLRVTALDLAAPPAAILRQVKRIAIEQAHLDPELSDNR